MLAIEVELGVLIATVVVLSVVVVVFAGRLLDRIYDREKAMDQHVKAVSRSEQRVTHAGQKALEDALAVREEVRVLHERVERVLGDPRVRRILDG